MGWEVWRGALSEEPFADGFEQAHEREVDSEWVHASEVKNLMVRLDPSFNEKALGYGSFSEFVKSRNSIAALDESTQTRLIRLRQR